MVIVTANTVPAAVESDWCTGPEDSVHFVEFAVPSSAGAELSAAGEQ